MTIDKGMARAAELPRLERDLRRLGIVPSAVLANLDAEALVTEVIRRDEAEVTADGVVSARTGQHTGRSPADKFVVREPGSAEKIWWGPVNHPLDPARFGELRQRFAAYLSERDVFVQDLYAAADPRYRLGARVVTELAWHSLFARDLLIRPTWDELASYRADWTVLDAPGFHAVPERDGVRSPTVIAISFAERLVLIGGTAYAGEIKKAVFTILNYLLPGQGVMPMHCSANVGSAGDVALFFGLSGTGKTTLSTDPARHLVGDDEHGWSDRGIFNFEGGCYAKVINLSPTAEPQIYAAIQHPGAVLENVIVDPLTRRPDLADARLTENTRAAYPIDAIPGAMVPSVAGHPTAILFLAADAFGVLPPIARLTPEQAMYHFLSGYTAQVAGTEVGLGAEPRATFSACFAHPFLPLHPVAYAELLGTKMGQHAVTCYLVNTGWNGGPYGVGSRMPIGLTRTLVRAALEGQLVDAPTRQEPFFGLHVPTAVPGIPAKQLDPRASWPDPAAYDAQARRLAAMFSENFKQFGEVPEAIRRAGPRIIGTV
jgi:phosphoenolpyruvate carboxykinase (ATP)